MNSNRNFILFRVPAILVVGMFALFVNVQNISALTIIRDFIGGTPPTNSIGSGNLTNIFNAACDVWQSIIKDDYTLTLQYGWTNNPYIGTSHTLLAQGGTPNRETMGRISFEATGIQGQFVYYLDPTALENEEYSNFVETSTNLGGGSLVCERCLSGGPVGPASQHVDLFTVAVYEVGHALGLSMANLNYIADTSNYTYDYIVIGPQLPYAGSVVPVKGNIDGAIDNTNPTNRLWGFIVLMGGGFAPGQRLLPSPLDVIVLAQISGFTNINWSALNDGPMRPTISMSAPFLTNGFPTVTLSWPVPWFGRFEVEQGSDFKLADWTVAPGAVLETNGVYSTSVPIPGNRGFFRLKQF